MPDGQYTAKPAYGTWLWVSTYAQIHLSMFYTLHCVYTGPDKWHPFKWAIHLSSIRLGRFDYTQSDLQGAVQFLFIICCRRCWKLAGSDALAADRRWREWKKPSCVSTWTVSLYTLCPTKSRSYWVLVTHTHTHLTALFPGLPGWAGTRKALPIWISLKQETVSGSGISWAICKSAPSSRQITMTAPHHSGFYRPDAFPAAQPTASKHWRHTCSLLYLSLLKVWRRCRLHCWGELLCILANPNAPVAFGKGMLQSNKILQFLTCGAS